MGTSDQKLTALHDALKAEFRAVQASYTAALEKLEALALCGKDGKAAAKGGQVSHSLFGCNLLT